MKLNKILSYLLTGIIIALAFPPFNIYPLMFAGMAVLIVLAAESGSIKEVFLKSYFVYFGFELVTVSWVSLSGLRENADRFMIVGGLLTILIHSALLTLPFLIYYFVRKKSFKIYQGKKAEYISLFTLPFIYTSIDYLYELPQVSFPWVIMGNAFSAALHKIQFIEFTGVYGLSFWSVMLSCLLAGIIIFVRRKGKFDYKNKEFIVLASAFIILFFIPDIYTFITSSKKVYTGYKGDGEIKIGIIQPNINPWKKWGAKQMDLLNDYLNQIREAVNNKPKDELLLMPETAMPFYLLEDYYQERYVMLKNVIDSIGVPLLTGTPDIVFYNDSIQSKPDSKINKTSGQKYDSFNSAVLIQPGEQKISHQKYNKIKLVIASERMPYQEKLTFLKDMIRWSVGISSFQIGWDTTIFNVNNKKFHTAICYESTYPEFYSAFADKGAGFSVIITNDGWWGKLFGTYQHNQYAVLRAVENRRWIARCANTGISCFIDPYGNMYQETEINERAYISQTIGLNYKKTFYSEHPYVFPNVVLVVAVGMVAVIIVLRKK